MKYKYKLKEIAEIKTGFQFRSRVQPVKDGNAYAVQIKDVFPGQPIDVGRLVRTQVDRLGPDSLLRPGQILFRARGGTYMACCYTGDVPNLLPASQFFVITLKSNRILPDYVAWYINGPEAQAYLARNEAGSSIKAIQKPVLEELEIPIPPLEKQRLIVKIDALHRREKALYARIRDRRDYLMTLQLTRAIQRA